MNTTILKWSVLLGLIVAIWLGCSDDTVTPGTTTTTTAGTTGNTNTGSTTGSTTSNSTTGSTTSSTTGSTTGNTTGSTTGGNFTEEWSFQIMDTSITATSFLADYGDRVYVSGLDVNQNLVIDFALPAKKGQTYSDRPFSEESRNDVAKGIIYVGTDQWVIVGGTSTVSKNTNNRISGTFEGKAYLYEYTSGSPRLADSTQVKNGVFKDIYVKG